MAVVRHKEAIHSGHFMVSNFEAEAQDDEEDIAVPVRITKFIVVNMTSWHHGGGHGGHGDGDGDEAIFYSLLLQRFLRRKPHRRRQTSSRRMSKIVSSNPPYFLPYHYCLPVLEGFLCIHRSENLCILKLASYNIAKALLHLRRQSKLSTESQVKQTLLNFLFPTYCTPWKITLTNKNCASTIRQMWLIPQVWDLEKYWLELTGLVPFVDNLPRKGGRVMLGTGRDAAFVFVE